MSYVKVLGYSTVSVILCMFINLTFSVFGGNFFKIICAVCTVGIMLCLQFNSAYTNAKKDMKNERITQKLKSRSRPFLLAFSSSAIPIFSTVMLWISSADKTSEFYRIYKILNAHYLQIFNLINPEVTSASLTTVHLIVYSLMALIPFFGFLIAYLLFYYGVVES